jgi:cytochrome c oxidase subunit 3
LTRKDAILMTSVLERQTMTIHARMKEPLIEPVHDPHLAHHFDTPSQQFEAAKFGMWLFLATEILLFGGLFCLYAVFRGNQPELFTYGSRFLDTKWGIINTIVLILSSLTMALAVFAAQTNRKRWLIACLALTIAGGAAFMGIKYMEYSHKFHGNLVWGMKFYQDPHADKAAATAEMAVNAAPVAAMAGDPEKGRALWIATCRTCHGVAGEGMTGQGKDIRGSTFIAERTDKQLVDFVKVGRMPFDPLNTTGIQMPPKGGNPMLKDADLTNIISYVRTFKVAAEIAPTESGEPGAATPVAAAPKEEFFIPKSVIPSASAAVAGLATNWDGKTPPHRSPTPIDPRRDPDRPANAHLFFGIYFLMTGLHGLHVLAGMAIISWLLVRAILGNFTAAYFTPVDLTGLYWHVVDIIWIFLFPLLYLIH